MGFFSFIAKAAKAVKSTVSTIYKKAKEVVSKAVEVLATKGEQLIESVKDTWKRMKPFVEKGRSFLQMGAAAAPIPWLKGALIAADKAVGALFAFENSPVLKKLEQAMRWAIALAKRIHEKNQQAAEQSNNAEQTQEESVLTEDELQTAKAHQANIRAAESQLNETDGGFSIALLTAINDFEIAKADITAVIQDGPSNFEHYLRLRATQKLLRIAEKPFRQAKAIEEISSDDIFIVRIASDLIKSDPQLNEQAADRLDSILQTRFEKKLMPFVFEEMIASWASKAEAEDAIWDSLNQTFIKDRMLEKRLSIAKRIQGELSAEEEAALAEVTAIIPRKQAELNAIETRKLDIDRYVGAAEGFLQVMEKEEEQIRAEENEFLISESEELGQLLMRCAESNIPFSDLTEDEQAMVTDYANIFKQASRERMANILEVQA
ncbi:hypothetical protein [Lampropedia aestuarii]|uniref:hypothetical protein n=1 Tax=Lampropedia aestuarii TaxID=2562762 RepID=UPI00246850F0|nr:hypothetical protein [Lampropedia aestuarii]MDH5859192.1 hypothetical protein [Lampropedia aestuarii]